MRCVSFCVSGFVVFILSSLLLVGCGSLVKEADYAPAVEMPEDANPAPLKWSGIKLLLPPGMTIGQERGGYWCASPAYPVNRNVLNSQIDRYFLRQTFHDAMEANGYDVVAGLDLIDEEALDDIDRAEYSIKATVKDVQLDMCDVGYIGEGLFNLVAPRMGTKGKFYTAIEWSVWDPVKFQVMYRVRTEGYVDRRVPNEEGLTLMFHDAFEMAAHNLAADPAFYDLVVRGVKPKNFRASKRKARLEKKWQERPRRFDPLEEVVLSPRDLSRQPFKRWAEEGRKAAVMIQKFGHGSGFFISEQGHILTNAHVVGDGIRTRVVTADRKHKIPAEILRIDKSRDVALLKLEEIPEGLEITTLPIRVSWPDVGEDIYAIGAPRDSRKLTDTLTKGIVSAHRKDYRLSRGPQNYIQGDVEVHGGNSGGALLDEYGNVVGITVGGQVIPGGGAIGMGLNYFIPIGEALETLNIKYDKGE